MSLARAALSLLVFVSSLEKFNRLGRAPAPARAAGRPAGGGQRARPAAPPARAAAGRRTSARSLLFYPARRRGRAARRAGLAGSRREKAAHAILHEPPRLGRRHQREEARSARATRASRAGWRRRWFLRLFKKLFKKDPRKECEAGLRARDGRVLLRKRGGGRRIESTNERPVARRRLVLQPPRRQLVKAGRREGEAALARGRRRQRASRSWASFRRIEEKCADEARPGAGVFDETHDAQKVE